MKLWCLAQVRAVVAALDWPPRALSQAEGQAGGPLRLEGAASRAPAAHPATGARTPQRGSQGLDQVGDQGPPAAVRAYLADKLRGRHQVRTWGW